MIKASSKCPICGVDTPHTHTAIEQGYYIKVQRLNYEKSELERKAAMLMDAAQAVRKSDCGGWLNNMTKRTELMEKLDDLYKALCHTQQTAEQYEARVKAEAKISLLREMIADAEENEGHYWPHNLQAIIEQLEAELRAKGGE